MKDYTPPPVETRLEKRGWFSWWLIIKVGFHTHKEIMYGTHRSAQRRLGKLRYKARHKQLKIQLED